jgi:hypothetical protein
VSQVLGSNMPSTTGTGAVYLEIKWSGLESDHPPPSSAEIKDVRYYACLLSNAYRAWCTLQQ